MKRSLQIPADGRFGNGAVAVIVHVFYLEIWPELEQCIRNIRDCRLEGVGQVDIFITYPQAQSSWQEKFAAAFPEARLFPVENRGWDVWPFFRVLNEMDLPQYAYVVKLHTKRDVEACWINFHLFRGAAWRRELISFCSSPSAVCRTFRALIKQPRLGMVAGERIIDPCGGGALRRSEILQHENLIRRMGFEPHERTMVYGTMFAVRASILMPAWKLYTAEDFICVDPRSPHDGYGLAGHWEIAFGLLVRAQGYYVSSGWLPGWLAKTWYLCKGGAISVMRLLSDVVRHSSLSLSIRRFWRGRSRKDREC